MYPLYTSKKQGGEQFEETLGILSISQQDHRNTTLLSSIITLCVGLRSLGMPLSTGGMLKDQQDWTIAVTYSKMKYRQQDK